MGNAAFARGKSWSNRIFDTVVYVIVLFVVVVTVYPFLNVLAISLNDSIDSVRGGITVFPRKFTWDNYIKIFTFSGLVTGFKISALRTVLGPCSGCSAHRCLLLRSAARIFRDANSCPRF